MRIQRNVDRNGILNSDDVNEMIIIYNNVRAGISHSYDDMQLYLADFDGNGIIDVRDSVYLNSFISTF